MEREIRERAKQLYDEVIAEYYSRDAWDSRPLSLMVDDKLVSYNADIKILLEAGIYSHLETFGGSYPSVVPTPKKLSEMLYRNAKEVSSAVVGILKKANAAKTGITKIARLIYDGYGFRDKEVLDIRKSLPKYAQRYIRRTTNQRQFERQIAKIKTKSLRAAYKGLSDAVESTNKKMINNALEVALEERSRYYANRIAQTEQHRAINLSRAKEYISDSDIELVKYRMSSLHPMMDICDYYANLDVGYGKGVAPKNKMVSLPLHPHCRCTYDPYYRDQKKRTIKNPDNATLRKFTKPQQVQILGGKDNYRKWQRGESVEGVFNSTRPNYKITPVVELL